MEVCAWMREVATRRRQSLRRRETLGSHGVSKNMPWRLPARCTLAADEMSIERERERGMEGEDDECIAGFRRKDQGGRWSVAVLPAIAAPHHHHHNCSADALPSALHALPLLHPFVS